MDVYCQKCGEPWEVCYVNGGDMDADGEAGDKERFNRGDGCPSCDWGAKAPEEKPFRSELMEVMGDLMGDDVDGIASMMDDAEYMMGDDFFD